MNRSLRRALTLGVVLGAALCASGLVRWGLLRTWAPDLLGQWRRQEALDHYREATRATAEGKRRVVAEVITGRLTLREAAGLFRQLHEAQRDVPDESTGARRLPVDESVLSRLVLIEVRAALAHDPARAARVLPRLEQEYRRHPNQAAAPANL